ncbi:flagellar biosynthesis anti-sigma factor FlgM [Desulfatitalea alkaliphila]|uniref:Negative regulator of flagellin synthesis n=1 Tax=Desulfatitalea alkaliphila TaxID=2929485 RepID=A0AA41R5L8_9BACT|nr:flagellar biosynthesis anti-sigma factor FlgM [Desulfatitalea alkaliphila]MCJ8501281.1 flagellar biosynthesis anti-sigma factor FlgM [Desulfatitalea alkaliphila]
MKVDGNNGTVELSAYLQNVQRQRAASAGYERQEETRPVAEGDRVELSERAREVQQASRAAQALPEVREEKVAQVKMEVAQGTYNVNGEQAATAMLKESMENEMVLQSIDVRV